SMPTLTEVDDSAEETRHCSRCGSSATCAPGAIPDGWSFAVEDGRTTYQCPPCVRQNIRAIEGKLPEEWWQ
ncbi:MAG: hypothetical protein ACLGHT_02595, partial [Acidimicrobiia bacterium]